MKTYITSDLHFLHKNVLTFCPQTRPYGDVTHMNKSMIIEWNNTVNSEDTVYIVGDFALGNVKLATDIASQLNGNKILIVGNHDTHLIQDKHFCKEFSNILHYNEIYYKDKLIVMFHYPILEWNKCHYGSIQLHGHVHGATTGLEQYRVKDVGMDATGKVVSLLDDIFLEMMNKEVKKLRY